MRNMSKIVVVNTLIAFACICMYLSGSGSVSISALCISPPSEYLATEQTYLSIFFFGRSHVSCFADKFMADCFSPPVFFPLIGVSGLSGRGA